MSGLRGNLAGHFVQAELMLGGGGVASRSVMIMFEEESADT